MASVLRDDLTQGDWPQGIARAPAPWVAHGAAYVVLTASSRAANLADAGIPEALRAGYRNFGNVLMAVDYQASPVGPYLELLYIPGRFRIGSAPSRMSISRIYVSSESAVVNGIANWGLPKHRAEFSRRLTSDGRDEFRVGVDGDLAQLSFRAFGPKLPIGSRWLPAALRSFVQVRDGMSYVYTLSLSGRMQAARVFPHAFDPARFPDMTKRRILSAVRISDFTVHFSASTQSIAI